jgi:hypothetical protein
MPGSCVHPRAPIRKAVGVCVSLLLAALACTSTPDRPVRRSGMWRCRPGRQRRRPSAEDDEAFPVQRSLRAIGVRARVEFFRAPGSSVSAKVGSRRTSRRRTNGSPMPPNGTQFFSPLYASEGHRPVVLQLNTRWRKRGSASRAGHDLVPILGRRSDRRVSDRDRRRSDEMPGTPGPVHDGAGRAGGADPAPGHADAVLDPRAPGLDRPRGRRCRRSIRSRWIRTPTDEASWPLAWERWASTPSASRT